MSNACSWVRTVSLVTWVTLNKDVRSDLVGLQMSNS